MRVQAIAITTGLALLFSACVNDPVINERPDPADADGDGFNELVDCNDSDGAVNPEADEKCDDVDNDCDGLIDERGATDAPIWYVDGDGDGFGDPEVTLAACDAPDSYIDNSDDCDDAQGSVYPGADELCDGLDNDCNDEIDDNPLDATQYYWDFDGDGYGDPERPEAACSPADWLVEDNTDCDDTTTAISPEIREVCDEIDNDCDGLIDDDDPTTDPETMWQWYADTDGDMFGDPDLALGKLSCVGGDGYADNPDDCDDGNPEATTDCEESR